MATSTAKLGLRKPAATDNVDVTADISDNMQKIDDGFAGIQPAFRNAIRNGDMSVAQRGNGPFTAAGHGIDGWARNSSGGSHSISRVATTPGAGLGAEGASYYLSSVVSGQSLASDFAFVEARIENVRTLAGKQVTLSFIASAASGTPKIGIAQQQYFGSGGSATVTTGIQAVTLSTVPTRYSITFTVASIVGKTVGTGTDHYLCIRLYVSAGANFAAEASSIGIQNTTIDITDVQLEAGSVATAFERLPQQVQLAWCQRYFYRLQSAANNSVFAAGFWYSTTNAAIMTPLPVQMRAVPAFVSGTGTGVFNSAGTPIAATGYSLSVATTSQILYHTIVVASGGVAGNGTLAYFATASDGLSFSAEL